MERGKERGGGVTAEVTLEASIKVVSVNKEIVIRGITCGRARNNSK